MLKKEKLLILSGLEAPVPNLILFDIKFSDKLNSF